jgi:hypothetical protein
MNSRQLQKLGVPEDCVKSAIAAIQTAKGTFPVTSVTGNAAPSGPSQDFRHGLLPAIKFFQFSGRVGE